MRKRGMANLVAAVLLLVGVGFVKRSRGPTD